jgi:hypothetical protein
MGKPWFRTKRYGFGAGAPCSWEGWIATLAFIVAMTLIAAMENLDEGHARLWVGLHLVTIAGFVVLVWRKSDLPWGWRWGQD